MRKALLLLMLLPALALFGCGGGGGGLADTPGGYTDGLTDTGSGGGSTAANLLLPLEDEVLTTNNALINMGATYSNGARVSVRKIEDVGTCTPKYDTVCSWTVFENCDSDGLIPNDTDWRCNLCGTVAGPIGTCFTNGFYTTVDNDIADCINVPTGEETCTHVYQTTYKQIVDAKMGALGGGSIELAIPASNGDEDLYTIDVVRYVAGDLLLAGTTTPCDVIGEIDAGSGSTCTFYPLDVATATLEDIVAADLHISRDYWQGQQNTVYGGIADIHIVSGPNGDVSLSAIDAAVLSLPGGDVYSGTTYQVANNRNGGDILRDNWYVRQEVTTAATLGASVFVSGGADAGTAAGTGALTLMAPATTDLGDVVIYHYGHFFLSSEMLKSGESYNDWTYVTNGNDVLVPMGTTTPSL